MWTGEEQVGCTHVYMDAWVNYMEGHGMNGQHLSDESEHLNQPHNHIPSHHTDQA